MAKKKKKKSGKKRSSGKSKSFFGIDIMEIGGEAGGVLAKKKFLDTLPFLANLDPKMKAALLIGGSKFAQNNSMVKGFIKDDGLRRGLMSGISVLAMDDLLVSMGIAGMGANEDREIALAIEGIDDIDPINEDVLGDDDDMHGDLDTVADDQDDMHGDLDTVAENVLGDDEDDMGVDDFED